MHNSYRSCTSLQIKTYFPSTSSPVVVREGVTDPGVDVIQTQFPLRCSRYCHGDERGIAVGGFPFGVRGGGVWYSG